MIQSIVISKTDKDGNITYSKAHGHELKNTNLQWVLDALDLDDFQDESKEEYLLITKSDLQWHCEMYPHRRIVDSRR